jgi:hypothetical protein
LPFGIGTLSVAGAGVAGPAGGAAIAVPQVLHGVLQPLSQQLGWQHRRLVHRFRSQLRQLLKQLVGQPQSQSHGVEQPGISQQVVVVVQITGTLRQVFTHTVYGTHSWTCLHTMQGTHSVTVYGTLR